MLVLLFVALWFILRGDSFYVLPCVILFLCFFRPLSIAITSLGEERANLCFSYVCSISACLDLSVSSFSWCLGRALVCDCGTPWTFLLYLFDWETWETRGEKNLVLFYKWLFTWRHSTYQLLFPLLLMKILVTPIEIHMPSEQSTHELHNSTTIFYHLQSVNKTLFSKKNLDYSSVFQSQNKST